MRGLFKYSLFILSFLCIMSCSINLIDDFDQENYFEYNGVVYPIEKVYYASMKMGSSTVSYLYFLTAGVDLGYLGGDFEGTGDMLYISEMARKEGSIHDGLSEGEYEFDSSPGETYDNFSFRGASIYMNFDSGISYETAQDGTISVKRNNAEHEIIINVKIDGSYVTGYYKGVLTDINLE